jgi:hypothetical protein
VTLVNADTGEVVELADETEARRIADGIGVALARVNVATGDLVENVATALHRRAWVALGHGSWDDLVAAEGWEFNPRTSTERAALAKVFRESGLSFRAIGKLVSASKSTVENDLRELSNSGQLNEPEMIAGTDGKDRPARRPEPVPEPDDLDAEPDAEPDEEPEPEPEPAPETAEQQAQRDLEESDIRAARRLTQILGGWHQLRDFHRHLRRDHVLALLDTVTLRNLTEAEEAIHG